MARYSLYMDHTGLLISYEDDPHMLIIQDLNPENIIQWRMTPVGLITLGLECIKAAWRSVE